MKRVTFVSIGVLAIVLAGCGGGGTPVAQSLHFDAPVGIQTPGDTTKINAVSPKGVMVGDLSTGGLSTPYIWANPTAAPTGLDIGAQTYVRAMFVNDDGVVAGYYNSMNQTLAVWKTPTSAPIYFLALPGFIGFPTPSCVGKDGTAYASLLPLVNVPTAGYSVAPASSTLDQVVGVDKIRFVANDGALYGDQVYVSGTNGGIIDTSTRPIVRWANGTYQYMESDPKYVNPATKDMVVSSGSGLHLKTLFTDTQIAGATGSSIVVKAVSDDRILVGYRINGDNTHTALVWTSPTTPPVELDSYLAAGSGWHLKEANFALANGSIVGVGTHTVGGVDTEETFYMHRVQ